MSRTKKVIFPRDDDVVFVLDQSADRHVSLHSETFFIPDLKRTIYRTRWEHDNHCTIVSVSLIGYCIIKFDYITQVQTHKLYNYNKLSK